MKLTGREFEEEDEGQCKERHPPDQVTEELGEGQASDINSDEHTLAHGTGEIGSCR